MANYELNSRRQADGGTADEGFFVKHRKTIHTIYGIILSALVLATAIVTVVMCVDIYNSGPSPFTRQSVYEHFMSASALIYVLVAFIVGGGVLNLVLPLEKKRLKGTVDERLVLSKLFGKLTGVSAEGAQKIEKQRLIRFIMLVISFVLTVGASVAAIVYLAVSFDVTDKGINSDVIAGTLNLLRIFAAPLIYLIVTAFVCKSSIKKELEIVKNELKAPKTGEGVVDFSENEAEGNQAAKAEGKGTFTKLSCDLDKTVRNAKKPKAWHGYLRIGVASLLACAAIVFIIVGIANGGMGDVLTKAINICTECIGMG